MHAAPSVLHHALLRARLHLALPRCAPVPQASDALHVRATRLSALLLVRPFAPNQRLLRPLLTSRSGSTPSPFQAQGEISPGKNALLRCTTAGFTPLRLDHESFAASCPLALLGSAFYPVLVHRLAASLHASFPRSVALTQLRFASFAVINLRRDLHPQECAHAGRTKEEPRRGGSNGLRVTRRRRASARPALARRHRTPTCERRRAQPGATLPRGTPARPWPGAPAAALRR